MYGDVGLLESRSLGDSILDALLVQNRIDTEDSETVQSRQVGADFRLGEVLGYMEHVGVWRYGH